MFTLKLFKRVNGQTITRTLAVHHVQTMEIGVNRRTMEIWAFKDEEPSPYVVYYVGEREPEMNALTWANHWGWALLENGQGNTTEHYRPAGHGWNMPASDEIAKAA
jgi:hypothetical protein